MPAVGMRRSTRVFGARVLRSGRRLWTGEPGEVVVKQQYHHHRRHVANNGVVEVIEILDDPVKECKEKGRQEKTVGLKRKVSDENAAEALKTRTKNRWGIVYQRKRKRSDMQMGDDSSTTSPRRYGKQFFRKQCKTNLKENPAVGGSNTGAVFAAVVEASCGSANLLAFSCFLNSILRYMRRVSLGLQQLSAFIFSEPIIDVYSSRGIHFLQDCTQLERSRVCKIMDSRCCTPMFLLDFSAVPSVFLSLHSSLLLRSAILSYTLVLYASGFEAECNSVTDDEEVSASIACEDNKSVTNNEVSANSNAEKRNLLKCSVASPKSTTRALQLRNITGSRSIQKRRSSVRLRKLSNLPSYTARKANGTLLTDLSFRHDIIPFSPAKSNHLRIGQDQKRSLVNVKELKSTSVGLSDDLNSSSCSANILVSDSEKCYREEGAIITLENSGSNQWFVTIKKGGVKRHNFMAQKVMRPCSGNRITNAAIWSIDNGWKLEFPNRTDWLIFKKLYKDCSDRNALAPTASVIPVPGVFEVSTYSNTSSLPFQRPGSYIIWKDDELTRALAKGKSNYDLDSGDEAWLNKFNNEKFPETELAYVSSDVFELIISSFEKDVYCGQEDYSDVRAAVDHCMNLERKEVLEAVHGYWINKRKQKRSALARVFQCYQPRRTQLLPQTILRKKRSFNRQASKTGRGKPITILQAMAAEREAVVEQGSILKIKEAEAAAKRSEDAAVLKRQRVQLLMEAADLAAYKATMALKIAEAAGFGTPEANNYFFIG